MAKKLFEKAGLIHHPLPATAERRAEPPGLKPSRRPRPAR